MALPASRSSAVTRLVQRRGSTVVRAGRTRTPIVTVKGGQLYRMSVTRMGCVGRVRTCTNLLLQWTGELPLTRPRTGAWRRARTADLRVTRAMLWPTELPRQDCWAGLGGE